MKFFIYILFTLTFSGFLLSQENLSDNKKLFNDAVKIFDDEHFDEALLIFIRLDSLTPGDFEINYYIGACYLNTKYDKIKGISYLEFAIKKGERLLPCDVFKDLGILYHLNYEFDKAKAQFERYIKLSEKNSPEIDFANRMIEICNYAESILSDFSTAGINILREPINTEQSELNPHVSADESIMYFSREYVVFDDLFVTDSVNKILISKNNNGKWSQPIELLIESDISTEKISIAGISPDGEQLYILNEMNHNTDIYTCYLSDRYCKNLTRLSDKINSAFWEGRCSISPNGRELYFSSSRPCGYGGKDLYKVTQNDLGNWNEAVNLGSSVNTKYDEDAPFIHPDNQTLYFSSNGHNTIGGYDIFKSHFNYVDNKWSDPQNMGHPINTTGDDINFVLSADGKFGYFASSQKSKYGTYDIYKLNLNRTIPLTLVKGIITSGDPPKPLKANIRVFDVEKNERVKYIYNPNPESGKYLMIFPPGKNYNMVIEAENFLPHILNIYIPEQNYFYELFQEINMTPISLNSIGKVIGEEISVKNLFYDIYKAGYLDSVYTPDDTTIKKDYTKLLQLIEELIEKTDSIGLEKLDKYSRGVIDESSEIRSVVTDKSYAVLLNKIEMAIELSDSISLEKLNEQTIYEDNTTKQYMYGIGNSTDSLVTLIIGNDTIITLAPLILNDNIKGNDLLDSNILKSDISGVINKEIKNSNKKMRSYKLQYDVYFESNSYKVTEQYFSKLDDIVALLINNNVFGVEINGYSDTSGDSENNKKLSEQRAMQIAKYFNSKNINTDRLIVFGFGENDFSLENSDNEKQKNRRVEILVFSIIDKN